MRLRVRRSHPTAAPTSPSLLWRLSSQRPPARACHRLRRTASWRRTRSPQPAPGPARIQCRASAFALAGQHPVGGATGTHIHLFSTCVPPLRKRNEVDRLRERAGLGATHCRASWPAYRAAAGCARARPATPRRRHGLDAAVRHHHPRARPGIRIRPARELIVRATALPSTVPASSPPGPTPGHPPLRAIRGQVRNSPSHRRLAGHVSPPQLLSAHPSLPPATLGPTDTLRIPPLKCLYSVDQSDFGRAKFCGDHTSVGLLLSFGGGPYRAFHGISWLVA